MFRRLLGGVQSGEVENTFGNHNRNLEVHLKSIDLPKKLGQRRFKIIKTALNPTIEEGKHIEEISPLGLVNAGTNENAGTRFCGRRPMR